MAHWRKCCVVCVVCDPSHLRHLCAGSCPNLLFCVSSASGIPAREAKRDGEVDSKVLFGRHDSVKKGKPHLTPGISKQRRS